MSCATALGVQSLCNRRFTQILVSYREKNTDMSSREDKVQLVIQRVLELFWYSPVFSILSSSALALKKRLRNGWTTLFSRVTDCCSTDQNETANYNYKMLRNISTSRLPVLPVQSREGKASQHVFLTLHHIRANTKEGRDAQCLLQHHRVKNNWF